LNEYLGHSKNGDGNGLPESLADHARAVVSTASSFAEGFSDGQSAAVAGWFHDLGKFADQMQQRLNGKDPKGRDHWSAGVVAAWNFYGKFGKSVFNPIAASIAGHHVGLDRYWERPEPVIRSLCQRMLDAPDDFTSNDISSLLQRHSDYGFPTPELTEPFVADESAVGSLLDTRMLFSTLVDADFLETEAHFAGDTKEPRRYRTPLPALDFQSALDRLTSYVDQLPKDAEPDVQRMRSDLFSHCLSRGSKMMPGIYTLSAPTGAGKTLAMLALALACAANRDNDVSRIVLSMPFLNIIDQTASEYRKLFSNEFGFDPRCILEDHSTAELKPSDLSDNDGNTPRESLERMRRLAAENWDGSVVLTTNVKLLESLQANRPARCRKLHRLANSIILFDEVQTIPPKLIKPTLATLTHLAERYNSAIVFATATQPAFGHLSDDVKKLCGHGWKPDPILSETEWMYEIADRRVEVSWQLDQPRTWDSIADEMADDKNPQSVCIVNLKRHAQELIGLLKSKQCNGVTHLSTNMCGVHRQHVLREVTRCLKVGSDSPMRLVSTQCIEAGVNLDSPVMLRALAPLESIAQAAGRCNRHGKRDKPGRVTVFKPEGKSLYPGGTYSKAANATESFLRQHAGQLAGNVLNNPQLMRSYYRMFYSLDPSVTEKKELNEAILAGDFVQTAKQYRLIDGDQINILVPYDKPKFNEMSEAVKSKNRPSRFVGSWIRKARQHSVTIHRPRDRNDPLWGYLEPVQFSHSHHVDTAQADWFILLKRDLYDGTLGLKTEVEFDGVI
jgi:CRISPR-associated helicase Cas3/CRISPR-associated endonuclease Cas3-HD